MLLIFGSYLGLINFFIQHQNLSMHGCTTRNLMPCLNKELERAMHFEY
uniref:Uncharacterized protein n=1 Tax=Rhizophora mucronata TaxID=61149 RepID=A0A2P2N1H0_RHIMU